MPIEDAHEAAHLWAALLQVDFLAGLEVLYQQMPVLQTSSAVACLHTFIEVPL